MRFTDMVEDLNRYILQNANVKKLGEFGIRFRETLEEYVGFESDTTFSPFDLDDNAVSEIVDSIFETVELTDIDSLVADISKIMIDFIIKKWEINVNDTMFAVSVEIETDVFKTVHFTYKTLTVEKIEFDFDYNCLVYSDSEKEITSDDFIFKTEQEARAFIDEINVGKLI